MIATETLPKVYIIIVNWNGWQDTIECLESLLRINYTNYQIVVCDNDSQNRSVEKIQSWAKGELAPVVANPELSYLSQPAVSKPIETIELDRTKAESGEIFNDQVPLVLIRTGGNLGFAAGNNVGIRYAINQTQCDFVWMLNNDTVVDPEALIKMLAHSANLQEKGIKNSCGSVQRFYYAADKIQALGGFRMNKWTGICSATLGRGLHKDTLINHNEVRSKMHAIHGCSWLLPRYFLDEIGLMEERYFLYYEEIDWALRSPQYALTYADDAIVYHKEGGSIGSRSLNRKGSALSEFYANRNKYKLAFKFNPWAIPTIFIGILGQGLNALRKGDLEKFLLLFQVAFGKSRL